MLLEDVQQPVQWIHYPTVLSLYSLWKCACIDSTPCSYVPSMGPYGPPVCAFSTGWSRVETPGVRMPETQRYPSLWKDKGAWHLSRRSTHVTSRSYGTYLWLVCSACNFIPLLLSVSLPALLEVQSIVTVLSIVFFDTLVPRLAAW